MKMIGVHPLNRRDFIRLAGWGSLGLGLRATLVRAQEKTGAPKQPRVYAIWRYVGSVYYFDPFGLYVEPGETVGFVIGGSSGREPTVTAYHPDHDNHELRIPENARPFDSGYIPRPNPREPAFQWKFEVEGTYDYFSKYEEAVGMIGRIVVGKPGGPGEKPWGYGNREGRNVIPEQVLQRAKLLDSQEIVKKKAIPFPFEQFHTAYPLW